MSLMRFAGNFLCLSPECTILAWQSLATRHLLPPPPSHPSGSDLYDICEQHQLHQADVVVSVTSIPGPVAEGVLTTLVGPIIRKTTVQPQTRLHRAQQKKRDPRVITAINGHNPKKEGTRAHRLFELYRVGMTVDEFIAAGGRRSAIRHDTAHGFITVEAPRG